MNTTSQDRLQQLYSQRWIGRLKAFAGKRYHEFGDWEGWFEEAHQNLALKCSSMPDDQPMDDALILAVFKNELISVKRNRLGYPRPRAWLREFSRLGQDLFEWMCLQKLPRRQIIEKAMARADANAYAGTAPAHREFLMELTDTMISKRECDGVRPVTTDIDDEATPPLPDDTAGTEENTEHAQLSLVLSLLLGADAVDDTLQRQASERLSGMREALASDPLLDDMDILILRCYYFQGQSQNDIARQLQLPLQKVVRQREAAIRRIRAFMETHGMTREAFGF